MKTALRTANTQKVDSTQKLCRLSDRVLNIPEFNARKPLFELHLFRENLHGGSRNIHESGWVSRQCSRRNINVTYLLIQIVDVHQGNEVSLSHGHQSKWIQACPHNIRDESFINTLLFGDRLAAAAT
jgi:hypothetical protein